MRFESDQSGIMFPVCTFEHREGLFFFTQCCIDVRKEALRHILLVPHCFNFGKHTIRLENLATQDHEMFIVRLEKGKTPADVAQWAENPKGPPPGMPLGGTSGMRKGSVAYVPVDLAPGEYALLCFIPDAKDGKPHYVHGMMKQFTVS